MRRDSRSFAKTRQAESRQFPATQGVVPLLIVEPVEQCLDLGVLKVADSLLPLSHRAQESGEQQMPGLQDDIHRPPDADRGRFDSIRGKRREIKRSKCENQLGRNRRTTLTLAFG